MFLDQVISPLRAPTKITQPKQTVLGLFEGNLQMCKYSAY